MKIGFHGAARTVTGSKHLITLKNNTKILLDCGMFQGLGSDTNLYNNQFGFNPSEVDFVILSHAHIDHSGLIPKLVKDGYKGNIYATPATIDLASALMEDSARIQEADIKFVNKERAIKNKPLLQPLYTVNDALSAADRFVAIEYNIWTRLNEDISFLFADAGHIIGSATVHLRIQEEGKTVSISFSGDVGRYRDVLLKSPETFPQADYILLESTYGNSLHKEVETTPDVLLQWIEKTCIQKQGKLIMPAFSVGRTQEILYFLNTLEQQGRLPKLPYIVDSPLSIQATSIVKKYARYFNNSVQRQLANDEDIFNFDGLKFIKSVDESKALNYQKGPCVIISASGMAEAGRVKHHISNNIESKRNTILLTGYCEPQSLGARLKQQPETISIFGMEHDVNAEIAEIRSMSAHGDYKDLCQFLACQHQDAVKKLFLVHGEYNVMVDFKNNLFKKGFYEVEVPERHSEVILN